MDPVWNCDQFAGEEGADCFAFLWSEVFVLSVMACLICECGSSGTSTVLFVLLL